MSSPARSLSIITAAHPERTTHLREAAASVDHVMDRATHADPTLTLEWVLCWDGSAPPESPASARVLSTSKHAGISASRNLALAAATGDLVTTLDADDYLEPAGVLSAIRTLRVSGGLGWVAASRTLVDGSPTAHTLARPQCWKAGQLAEEWEAPFVFHPNSIVVRRAAALACGGWPALPANEDLGFVLQLSEASPGAAITEVLTRYRTWNRQEIADEAYKRNKRLAFSFIEASVNASRHRRRLGPISAPADPGGGFGAVARS